MAHYHAPIYALPDSCGDPGEVEGSMRTVSDPAFGFGSTIAYVCEAQHRSGDLVRTCQRETGWSGQSPKCGGIIVTLHIF